MKPFEFKVISKCFQDASRLPGNDADFYLEENNWNDYHFYVLYYLHATKRITGTKILYQHLDNRCEQMMRHIKMNLKNSMNIGSEESALDYAFMFSAFESCDINHLY